MYKIQLLSQIRKAFKILILINFNLIVLNSNKLISKIYIKEKIDQNLLYQFNPL